MERKGKGKGRAGREVTVGGVGKERKGNESGRSPFFNLYIFFYRVLGFGVSSFHSTDTEKTASWADRDASKTDESGEPGRGGRERERETMIKGKSGKKD